MTIFFHSIFNVREEERSKKKSTAAEVLAPSSSFPNATDFYTGGGKRGYGSNIDARNMMAEAFMNRPGNYQVAQYPPFPIAQNVASYPHHGYYAETDDYGRGRSSRSRSRSQRRRREYSSSEESYSSGERGRKRSHKKKRSYLPVTNNNDIVTLD